MSHVARHLPSKFQLNWSGFKTNDWKVGGLEPHIRAEYIWAEVI